MTLGEIFLGLIALAALTTAIVELTMAVWLVRSVLRTIERVERLSRQLAPIAAHMTAVGNNLTRSLSLAIAQLDRAAAAYSAVARPAQQLVTALTVARGVAGIFHRWSARRVPGPRTPRPQ